jgi:hypothetical protein
MCCSWKDFTQLAMQFGGSARQSVSSEGIEHQFGSLPLTITRSWVWDSGETSCLRQD